MKHKKFIIGGLIIVAAIVILVVVAMGNSITYYDSVSDFRSDAAEVQDKTVKVHGHLLYAADESLEGSTHLYTFNLYDVDDDQNAIGDPLTIIYNGSWPDQLTVGRGLTVQGCYHSDGSFHASDLLVSCPSKYEAREEE